MVVMMTEFFGGEISLRSEIGLKLLDERINPKDARQG
jgi:hypothetical protein